MYLEVGHRNGVLVKPSMYICMQPLWECSHPDAAISHEYIIIIIMDTNHTTYVHVSLGFKIILYQSIKAYMQPKLQV